MIITEVIVKLWKTFEELKKCNFGENIICNNGVHFAKPGFKKWLNFKGNWIPVNLMHICLIY